jgi:hypothetical protein
MRELIGGLLIALIAVPAGGHTPFEPLASSPDHVVTMIETDGPGKKKERVVMHHGEWTRTETTSEGRRATQYFKRDEAVTVRIGDGKADEYATVSIVRGPERVSDWDYTPIKTPVRETFLGETCAVWEVLRARDTGAGRSQLTRLSCVTDDGIELWYKIASGAYVLSRAEATRIERRAIAPNEVQPPRDLLSLDAWFDDAPATANTPSSFETVLERVGDGTKTTRTIRRRGGWTSIGVVSAGALQTLEVSHASGSFTFRIDAALLNAPALLTVMMLRSPPASGPPLPANAPMDLGKHETVLGEQCRWFDMMPGVQDASHAACRTQDGITLKEDFGSWGSHSHFGAIRFLRRPVGLDEIKPPPALLARNRWGLPE